MIQYARQNTATVRVRLREKLAQFNKVSTPLWTTLPTDHFHITVDHSTNRPSPRHCGPLYQQTISTSLWTPLPTDDLHVTVDPSTNRPFPHHCGPLYQQTISTSLWTTLTTEVSTLLWTTLSTSHLHITVENYKQRVAVVALFV